MTVTEFKATLAAAQPATGLGLPLLALWYDGRGDWNRAHETAQEIEDETGAWIHAYLHRKEGDASNAAYWYSRAGKPVATVPLETEWNDIVATLLKRIPATDRPDGADSPGNRS